MFRVAAAGRLPSPASGWVAFVGRPHPTEGRSTNRGGCSRPTPHPPWRLCTDTRGRCTGTSCRPDDEFTAPLPTTTRAYITRLVTTSLSDGAEAAAVAAALALTLGEALRALLVARLQHLRARKGELHGWEEAGGAARHRCPQRASSHAARLASTSCRHSLPSSGAAAESVLCSGRTMKSGGGEHAHQSERGRMECCASPHITGHPPTHGAHR